MFFVKADDCVLRPVQDQDGGYTPAKKQYTE